MALPDSGQISISQLRTNFGGSTPDGLKSIIEAEAVSLTMPRIHLSRNLGSLALVTFIHRLELHQEI